MASIKSPPAGHSYAAAQASGGGIESHPLAAPTSVARYSAPSTPNPPLMAQNSPTRRDADIRTTGSTPGWSAAGGTPLVVADGQTAGILAVRYGVPVDALLHANGFTSAAQVRPGTRLVIPVYNASVASARPQHPVEAPRAEPKERILPTRFVPPAHVASREPVGRTTLHFVKGPEPVRTAPGRIVADRDARDVKNAKTAERTAPKPAAGKSAGIQEQNVARADKPAAIETKRQAAALRQPVGIDTTETSSLPPAATAFAPSTAPAAPSTSVASAAPEFRWPAHGRIIQGFKAGGNDGINIAVPEGTAIKAVDDGVVAYAGDELKGYGKLVLIRHSNGFVSAYADNQDLEVKRGDTVKRGQVIAKSGETGNVASPQLHFELRKGSTPVDPTQYLAGL